MKRPMTRPIIRRALARVAASALLALPLCTPATAFELPPRDAFDAMVQRPLFFPSRRAAPAMVESAPPATPAITPFPAEGTRVIGVAVDRQGRAIAVLRAAAGSERRVSVGDRVQGWIIDGIGRGGLTLSVDDQRAAVPVLGLVPPIPDKPVN